VKVLTFNLQWWLLFQQEGGLNGAAGTLIAATGQPQPYDVMAFQECQDPNWVLRDAGLLNEYTAVQGGMAVCMAYRTANWQTLAMGQAEVAEDQPGSYFGRRMVQWARLLHRQTGKVVLFANHHGPLGISSGGICGGMATAHNLLNTIYANSAEGDSVILMGDFNACAGSETIMELEKYLRRAQTGQAYGGVDHIFTNQPFFQEGAILANSGSDHNAMSIVIDIAGAALPPNSAPGASTARAAPEHRPSSRTPRMRGGPLLEHSQI